MPLSRVRALLDEAARRKNDPLLGLHLAAVVPEGTYEAAELLVRTAPTIGAGLAALAKHASLVNPIGQFRYEVDEDHAELHYLVPGQRHGLGVHMNEYTIAYILRGIRLIEGDTFPVAAVWFAHEREASAAAHVQSAFGSRARFGAATSGFSIGADVAARSPTSRDGVVFAYLSRQAEKASSELGPSPFSAQIARAIETELGFADATLSSVAQHLGMTARTAQRRLREEGTQFRDVIDHARNRRHEELLKKGVPDLKVAEALGFADAGTYRRAAKRWRSSRAE